MPDNRLPIYFAVFNEIGIIAQLSRAMFEARLPAGLVLPHFAVLNHLIRVGDGPTPLDLARAFQVPKTSMTHTLAGLQGHGFIDMRPNEADGRSKRVWITDAGRAFREQAVASLAPDVERLASVIPRDDMADLLPRLEKLRTVLDALRN